MAVLLMKLRYVPDDELAEIETLLEEHELEFYSTTAGSWGISLPALWLVDAGRLDEARDLLQAYAQERQSKAKALYEALKESGQQRTVMDLLRENPLRYLLYIGCVLALMYFSLAPFIRVH